MRTRVATQLDEAAALDVVRADGEATGRQPSKAALAALRAVLRSPTTLTLVADDAGAVVGLLVAELRGTGLVVTRLCVAPAHRRRGTGRALVRALQQRYPQVVDGTGDAVVQRLLDAGPSATGGHGPASTVRDRIAP